MGGVLYAPPGVRTCTWSRHVSEDSTPGAYGDAVLRLGVTGPIPDAVDGVVAALRRVGDDDTVTVHLVPWPADLDAAARYHLVVGATSGDAPASDAVDVWIAHDGAEALWRERIVPFAANLAAGRRAPRRRVAQLVDSDSAWTTQAQRLIARIRSIITHEIVRADHIGSTSVPGLPAKDLVDIQVVVPDLDAAGVIATRAAETGLVDVGDWDAPDRTGTRYVERVLVDADPGRPTTVNLRAFRDPVWRETLLFRDWLRASSANRDAYLAEKRRLEQQTDHVDAYSDGKLDWITDALGRAEHWAAATDWQP